MKDIKLERKASETKFFWRKGRVHPAKDGLSDLLAKAVFSGRCSGSNFDRFDHGEIVVFFNKIYHNRHMRLRLEREIEEFLADSATGLAT